MLDASHPIMLIILGIISGSMGAYLLRVLLPDLETRTKSWDRLLNKYSELNREYEKRLKNMEAKVKKLENKLKNCKKWRTPPHQNNVEKKNKIILDS